MISIRPKSGRRRSPDIESRVLDASIAIYARGGWRALTFDAVALSAGVGKGAIYRRWNSRGELLRHALEARWLTISDIDEGSLREDLLLLARSCLHALIGPHGGVLTHLQADAQFFKEAREVTRPYSRRMILQARRIIRRALDRGDLPTGADPSLLIDVIIGGVTNHVVSTPKQLRSIMIAKSGRYVVELVDLALRGIEASRAS